MATTHPPAKPRRLGFLALLPGLFAFAVCNVMTWAQAWGMTHDQPAGVRSTRIRALDAWGMGRFLPPYIFCTAQIGLIRVSNAFSKPYAPVLYTSPLRPKNVG